MEDKLSGETIFNGRNLLIQTEVNFTLNLSSGPACYDNFYQVKGYSQSSLGSRADVVPPHNKMIYERVWDEADYVVPPAENGAFFITTNLVITPNQTMGQCPEV